MTPSAMGSITQQVRDELVREAPRSGTVLRRRIARAVRREQPEIAGRARAELIDACVDEVGGLGPLETLLADPSITEILYCGRGVTYVERHGVLEPIGLELCDEMVVELVHRIVAPLGLRFDRMAPIVDARRSDGSRVHAVLPPLAVDGPTLCIRRFSTAVRTLDAFGVTPEVRTLLETRVRNGWNLLVSGGTSSGKTTLLGALTEFFPLGTRVITVEDSAELALIPNHVVRLEARPANSEGAGAVSLRELVRAALRMRPDRLIVGEVRGPEAFDMLQACNTGHDGSCSSVHANSTHAALQRLVALCAMGSELRDFETVHAHLATGIDAILHVARREDGVREVVSIADLEYDGIRCRARTVVERRDGVLHITAQPRIRPARADR
ncbi:MAG: CpaF family protein [Acidimicrobiia bacterium]